MLRSFFVLTVLFATSAKADLLRFDFSNNSTNNQAAADIVSSQVGGVGTSMLTAANGISVTLTASALDASGGAAQFAVNPDVAPPFVSGDPNTFGVDRIGVGGGVDARALFDDGEQMAFQFDASLPAAFVEIREITFNRMDDQGAQSDSLQLSGTSSVFTLTAPNVKLAIGEDVTSTLLTLSDLNILGANGWSLRQIVVNVAVPEPSSFLFLGLVFGIGLVVRKFSSSGEDNND